MHRQFICISSDHDVQLICIYTNVHGTVTVNMHLNKYTVYMHINNVSLYASQHMHNYMYLKKCIFIYKNIGIPKIYSFYASQQMYYSNAYQQMYS